jgi:hypothetical protein
MRKLQHKVVVAQRIACCISDLDCYMAISHSMFAEQEVQSPHDYYIPHSEQTPHQQGSRHGFKPQTLAWTCNSGAIGFSPARAKALESHTYLDGV